MVWLLLLVMIGKPSGVKVQLIQYQAHFANSSYPPVVWRRCSQPWATSWRLLIAVSRKLCNQSLVHCRLSSTKPIIVFPCDLFLRIHDNTSFIKLFESSHHRSIDEYPLSAGWSSALSRYVCRILSSILVMAWSYFKCSLYSVFGIEKGSWVYPTNLI